MGAAGQTRSGEARSDAPILTAPAAVTTSSSAGAAGARVVEGVQEPPEPSMVRAPYRRIRCVRELPQRERVAGLAPIAITRLIEGGVRDGVQEPEGAVPAGGRVVRSMPARTSPRVTPHPARQIATANVRPSSSMAAAATRRPVAVV